MMLSRTSSKERVNPVLRGCVEFLCEVHYETVLELRSSLHTPAYAWQTSTASRAVSFAQLPAHSSGARPAALQEVDKALDLRFVKRTASSVSAHDL